MKKIFTLCALTGTLTAFAQSPTLQILDASLNDVSNGTYYVQSFDPLNENGYTFGVKNTGTTAIALKMRRENPSTPAGYSNYFCWDVCIWFN